MTETPGDSLVQFIRSTLSPAEVLELCAGLLGVDAAELRAWLARREDKSA